MDLIGISVVTFKHKVIKLHSVVREMQFNDFMLESNNRDIVVEYV